MNLTEYTSCYASKVEGNVMKDVLVLGNHKTKNKRFYTKKAISNAVNMYENAPVYVDHQPDLKKGRKLNDRFGTLKNVRQTDDGLRADLHYLESHPSANMIKEDSENNTGMFGLSHHVLGNGRRTADGCLTVTEIAKVVSCDVVSAPASTRSLFEQQIEENEQIEENNFEQISEDEKVIDDKTQTEQEAPVAEEDTANEEMKNATNQVILAILNDNSLSLEEKLGKIKIALENGEELTSDEDKEDNPKDKEEDKTEQTLLEVQNQLNELKKQFTENIYVKPRTQATIAVSEQKIDYKELGKEIRGEK